MNHEEICNILIKKKLSGSEKLDLVKESILINPDIINTLINRKAFEYSNVVGLSLLYVPEVFNFITKNSLPIDYSVISKNNENLLHIVSRSKYQWQFIENILPNTIEYINEKDINGNTPILNSLYSFQLYLNRKERQNSEKSKVINLLIKEGAKLDFKNDSNNPLYVALCYHDYETLDILIKNGMNINILINSKPLALYKYKVLNNSKYTKNTYTNFSDLDKLRKKENMVNYLISKGYDYTIFNKKNEWKIDLLNEVSGKNENLISISNTLMKEGMSFEFNFKEVLSLFCKLKQNISYIDIIKLLENINVDYTKTDDKKNILSFTCNGWNDKKESEALFNYFIENDIKIDVDVFSFSFNTDRAVDINKAVKGRHLIEKSLNFFAGQQLVNVLSFVDKNLNIENGNKIPIDFNFFLSIMKENKLKFEELAISFDKLFDKVYATKWNGIKEKDYIDTPIVDVFMNNNVYLKEVHMEYLLEILLSQVYYKSFCASVSELVSQKTGECYNDSFLKKYIKKYPEYFANKNIKEWVEKQNMPGSPKNNKEGDQYLKTALIAVIEHDILKNSLDIIVPVNVQKRRI